MVQLSHAYMTTEKTIALTRQTFVGKVMSLLFNMLSRFVIAFISREGKCPSSPSSSWVPATQACAVDSHFTDKTKSFGPCSWWLVKSRFQSISLRNTKLHQRRMQGGGTDGCKGSKVFYFSRRIAKWWLFQWSISCLPGAPGHSCSRHRALEEGVLALVPQAPPRAPPREGPFPSHTLLAYGGRCVSRPGQKWDSVFWVHYHTKENHQSCSGLPRT